MMAAVGSQNCPHCGASPEEAAVFPFGLVDCRSCLRRIWYLTVRSERLFFTYEESVLVRKLFRRAVEHQTYDEVLNIDSLDKVELVLNFEEELEAADERRR